MEKQGGKKDLIWPISPSGFEIIFKLLAELIVIQVSIPIIQDRRLSFKEPLIRCKISLNLIMFLAPDK